MRHIVITRVGMMATSLALMAGCQLNQPSGGPTSTAEVIITGASTPAPVITPGDTSPATEMPGPATETPLPESTAAATVPSDSPIVEGAYLDDRSDPERLIASLVNALNRREYLRAYSYWDPGGQVVPYSQFEQSYSDTQSVSYTLGTITGDAGAGQFYYSVPTVFTSRTSSGQTRVYAGCYVLHLANPSAQATPPYYPLAIRMAPVMQIAVETNVKTALAQVCDQPGIPQGTPGAVVTAGGAAADRYLDDRSDPGRLIASLVNALNRREYLRAYSYWEQSVLDQLPEFPQFQQGYSNTQSVSYTLGLVIPDAGAGQFHYSVPITLKAIQHDGKRQTFVGCYLLHMTNPGMQQSPPFQPLGITSANVELVDEGADTTAAMQKACQSGP